MKAYKFNRQDRTCAPWAALCVLGLVAAMVFAVPSGVFAQIIYELSQDCETARFGTEHTITATVTNAGVPVEDVALAYMVQGVNPKLFPTPIGFTNEEGIVEFGYTGSNLGIDNIWLVLAPPNSQSVLDTITTEWTEEDLCSSSQQVLVGGRLTLNPKKRGALKIAVCGTKDFEVSNVDPEKVRLAGVAPWHWKQKDSRLCPDGKDGVVDLVLKFKNRDVVEALEKDLDKELVVVDKDVRLALEGKLNDGTAFGGEWVAEIKKKGKRHGKNEQYQNHKNGKGKGPNK